MTNISLFIANITTFSFFWDAQQTFNYALNTSPTTLPHYITNSIGYSYISSNTSGTTTIANSSTILSNTITLLSVGIYMVYSNINLSITASSGNYATMSAQIYFNGNNQVNTKQNIYTASLPSFSLISLQHMPLCINVSSITSTVQCQYYLSSSIATIYNLNCVFQAVKIA